MTDRLEQWVAAIEADGFVVSTVGCDQAMVDSILACSKTRITQVMDALGDREIGIGSAAGYDEIVQRSPGRWDLPISPQEFGVDERDFPWWPLVMRVLGEDVLRDDDIDEIVERNPPLLVHLKTVLARPMTQDE